MTFTDVVQIAKNAQALSVLIDGADYSVDFGSSIMEPVLRTCAERFQVEVAGVHERAIQEFSDKTEVLMTKHKSTKVVNIRNFVRSLRYDEVSQRLHIEMKIVDSATVGIQHVARAIYGAGVEFPITRERLYVWSDGVKTSPLYQEWERIQTQKHMMDLTV